MPSNVEEGVIIADHGTLEERVRAAGSCAIHLKLSMPILLDTMEDTAEQLYRAWPERLYILSAEGAIVYQGGKGPYGFDPEALAAELERL